MKCAIGSSSSNQTDDSEYNKILSELGQTSGDKIEIAPKGCEPVSESQCKSGFMAPRENITFPENSLATCCKCKEGEVCTYCVDKSNCTDSEKAVYVTNEGCFGEKKVIGPSPADFESESESETSWFMKNKWYILVAIVLLIVLMITIKRRFFTRPSIQIQ